MKTFHELIGELIVTTEEVFHESRKVIQTWLHFDGIKNSVGVTPHCFSSCFSLCYLCTSQILAGGYQPRIGRRPEEKIE